MQEQWRKLKGFEGYEVSNEGRLKALSKPKWNGFVYYDTPEKIMKQSVTKNGYLVARISNKTRYVHRMVAKTFLENDEFQNLDVNHIDGDKTNNHISNLEWCTRDFNIKHAERIGLTKKKNLKNSTITEEKAIEIIKIHKETGFGKVLLQRHYFPDISLSCLQGITNGKTWKHLPR